MNLVILGPQGCGKGTQAKLLAEKFNLAHVETGAALRAEAESDPEIKEIVYVKKELVPDEVVMRVLNERMKNVPAEQGVILDGTPRIMTQTDEAENAFLGSGRKLDKVIYVNISEKESVLRISKRFHCSMCRANLDLGKDINNPTDSCPECGGKIEQRVDDTIDGVRKRLKIFAEETLPVIEYYRKKGMLIEIDGEKSVEKVFQDIVEKLEK